MEQNRGLKVFIERDENYSSVSSNFNDYSIVNQPASSIYYNFSDVENKLIKLSEYLKTLERILLEKTALLIKNIEKNCSIIRKYIIKQRLQFETIIAEKHTINLPDDAKKQILSIDISSPKTIFSSASSFCKKIDEWYSVNIFIYNINPSPSRQNPKNSYTPMPVEPNSPFKIPGQTRPISDQFAQNPFLENTYIPTPEGRISLVIDNQITATPNPKTRQTRQCDTEVNEEIIITAHSNQSIIQVVDLKSFKLKTKQISGMNNIPYWPVIEQIDPHNYFFYGGIINRKTICSCYVISFDREITFSKKRDYVARSYASAVKYQNCIYVFGGSNIYLGNENGPMRDCSKYDFLANSWSTITSLDRATCKNSSSCVFNKIFVVGNDYQYCLEYNVREDIYTPIFSVGTCEMLILADRWILKRDSQDIIEITENGSRTHRMRNYWNSSTYGNLEFQSNVFKKDNMIYLVEHVIDRVPKIFKLDTVQKQLDCISGN